MTGDIAIIGMAGVFPGAADLASFHVNLLDGRSSVGAPSPERVRNGGGDPHDEYLSMGYLDRLDLFDYDYFGIPHREAELMDPQQRFLLQLTHEAIESAGYAPGALRGSAGGVLMASNMTFDPVGGDGDVVGMLGASAAAFAARLSYVLDLRGPALVVDTACSSGLSALHLAVGMLRSGRIPFAVVGAVNLVPWLRRRAGYTPMPGLESPDQVCRPFDAGANGMVVGEGGGVLVVKPFATAVADSDNVLAVVKGVAVNHNGYRAASMAAPSQVAQADVVAAAWRDGDVDAESVGYVECHGSGTALGDVVEADAIRRAFEAAGVTGRHCAIGSVKANLGHLGNAAGMAGLFKAISAVRYGVRYPAANLRKPNPLIDFSGPVFVNPRAEAWTTPDGGARRAGVSSLGLTGTNVHAVVEEAVAEPRPRAGDPEIELVTVSAKSPQALARYRSRLADFAEHTGDSLRAVAHVLNRGRDDHPYRLAVTAGTLPELGTALREAGDPEQAAADSPSMVLLFSGDAYLDDLIWYRLRAQCGDLVPLESDLDADFVEPASKLVVRQYVLYRVAESLGLVGGANVSLVGSGAGNLVTRVIRDKLTLAEAAAEAAERGLSSDLDHNGLRRVVGGFARDGAIAVELTAGGALAKHIRGLAPDLTIVDLPGDGSRHALFERFGALYAHGARVDWDRYYRDARIERVEAPTYPFEPTSCWRADRPRAVAERERPARPETDPARIAEVERRVAAIWAELLDRTDVGPDSDYFRLGGTSLVGVGVLRTLGEEFGVTVTFADLYGHPTVGAFASRLAELVEKGSAATGVAEEPITRISREGPLPLSFGQEALWYLDQVNPASALYNVPGQPMRITGDLDVGALQDALVDMARRHEVLRQVFRSDEDGRPYTATAAPEPLMPYFDLSRMSAEQREERVGAIVREQATHPFDLARDTLFRGTLIKLGDQDHVLVLVYHHIVFDGWSPGVFTRDLAELYRARTTGTAAQLPELDVQYVDFVAWQRARLAGPQLAAGLEFWRGQLAGLSREELPLDRPRPEVQTYDGDLLVFPIDAEVSARVREYSRSRGVTTFVTMLAALDALLHQWGGLTDVCVGVATSGRTHPASNELVGYFNNLLPFRATVTPELSFDELVRRCAPMVAGVLDHEEIPLTKIIADGDFPRDPARHPLYDVSFTFQNVPLHRGGVPGLRFGRYEQTEVATVAPGTSKFDLTIGLADEGDGPILGDLSYATDLYDRATAERLRAWVPALVATAMANPAIKICDLTEPGGGVKPEERPQPQSLDVLLAIFADLLDVDQVGADDGFFKLGGDSIKSLQLVARARRAGVEITQQQVLQHGTPAALAGVARTRAVTGTVTVAEETGPIPLTPLMREFAERAGIPDVFTQSTVVGVPAGLDLGALKAALQALANHHEGLRTRLLGAPDEPPETWALDVAAPDAASWVRRLDAAGVATEDLPEVLHAQSRSAARRLDPRAGVMVQAVWVDRGSRDDGRLILAIHHLAVDAASWRYLLLDLAAAYAAVSGGGSLELPAAGSSLGQWARELVRQAHDPARTAELPAWERIQAAATPLLPGRAPDSRRDVVASTRRVAVALPPAVSADLLAGTPRAFHTVTADVLLMALAAAVAEWRVARGHEPGPLVIDVERHGREPLRDDLDVSRMVGWFACAHPVRLDPPVVDLADVRAGGPAAGRVVKAAKEQLAAVPADGVGYGMLRYLNPGTGARLAALPAAPICLNYLGHLTNVSRPGGGGAEPWRPLHMAGELEDTVPVRYAIEANAAVQGPPDRPELTVSMTFPNRLLDEDAVRELCEGWAAMLAGLAAHAARPDASGFVPSDFPLVELSQQEIDQIAMGESE